MFWEASLSFNIVQLPTPSSSSSSSCPDAPFFLLSLFPSLSLSLSLSQEWCLSLRLSAPAMSTPTLSCTWTWARTPGSSRGRMPRSESAAKPIWKQKHTLLHFYSTSSASYDSSLSLSPSRFLVSVSRTCISSCLSPTAWSTWICRARIAPSTRWVFDVYVQRFKQNAFLWLTVSTLCLTQLFGALLRGCCADLSHLNLSKNSFSHRLVTSLRLLQQQQQQKKPNLRIYRPYFTSKASSCLSSSLPLVSFFAIISVSHLMGNQKWALWESLEHCASSLWVCPLRKAELAALPA